MAVLKSLRFSVFKRDGFICQYCGRRTPAVILEADHIVPVSAGGLDEIENLVTACFDCNRGKGAMPLGVLPESVDPHDRTVEIAEREMQLREYNEIRRQKREREERDVNLLLAEWYRLIPTDDPPSSVALRRALDQFAVYDVVDAIEDLASAMEQRGISAVVPYFFGMLRSKANGN